MFQPLTAKPPAVTDAPYSGALTLDLTQSRDLAAIPGPGGPADQSEGRALYAQRLGKYHARSPVGVYPRNQPLPASTRGRRFRGRMKPAARE